MFRLRNLALIAGVLCLGLSPALAMSHEGGEEGEHMGPPPAPESLRPIFQEAIDSGDLSEEAEAILLFLNLAPEDREGTEPPEPEEGEGPDVKEELKGLFEDILAGEGLPEDAAEYLEMMLEHMEHEGEHMEHEGEHMGGCDGCGGGGGGGGCGGGGDGQGMGQGGGQGQGQGPRAELPEEVREQLQDIRQMYRDVMEIERDIRRGDGEPSEDVLAERNRIVQEIVDSVVDLLDEAEVNTENAPQLLRLLGPSFGSGPGGPGSGQGGQGG